MKNGILLLVITLLFTNCQNKKQEAYNRERVNDYKEISLTTDLSLLTDKEKQMIPLLIKAANIMDELFWLQAFGNQEDIYKRPLSSAQKELVKINYGPWDRLNNNKPFIQGYGEKPLGAKFYPADMTREEFEAFEDATKLSLYNLIRRNDDGSLKTIPYNIAYKEKLSDAAETLKEAAALAENAGLKEYLTKRADAFLSNEYYESDLAWMDMKTNRIEVVIGPIETYEDRLYGYKAAFEAYVLVKDMAWSEKLNKYADLLPVMQENLPVPDKYKQEQPGTDSELNAYEAIYYAGDCNAGSKTIAINLPNDEKVQEQKGSRRLQLKNTMKAKFDHILKPISEVLIVPEQLQHVTFDAFFENTMFHEVAHGLGIKNTLTSDKTVREALQDRATILEEGKADILGLYLVTELKKMNEIDVDLMDNYVTFMAGIFRSVRFGASSSHGVANLMRFNYFKEKGAFYMTEDEKFGIHFDKMQQAIAELSEKIITIQGDGDYDAAGKLVDDYGNMNIDLQNALKQVEENGIPVDLVFDQGVEVLEVSNYRGK
ncbi:MAG: Zn-dependent hydrolase [Bacteroidetes bacterium]|jgi:hypothetical protein|nr:Zn-dependent hydrolase [Bacteroidota bacterium]